MNNSEWRYMNVQIQNSAVQYAIVNDMHTSEIFVQSDYYFAWIANLRNQLTNANKTRNNSGVHTIIDIEVH